SVELDHLLCLAFEPGGVARVNGKTIFSEPGGGFEKVSELFLTEMMRGVLIDGYRSGHAAGQRSGLAEAGFGFSFADKHVPRGRGGTHQSYNKEDEAQQRRVNGKWRMGNRSAGSTGHGSAKCRKHLRSDARLRVAVVSIWIFSSG